MMSDERLKVTPRAIYHARRKNFSCCCLGEFTAADGPGKSRLQINKPKSLFHHFGAIWTFDAGLGCKLLESFVTKNHYTVIWNWMG
jgi:hypothetical protein